MVDNDEPLPRPAKMLEASSKTKKQPEVSPKLQEVLKNPPDKLTYYAHPEDEEEEQEEKRLKAQDIAR